MVARKKTRKGGPRKTSAHVRGASDIPAFMELLKNMKILVVIITADWCGHCQRRKGEFQELMNMSKAPGVGVAQVDETQVKNIPDLSKAKINGYPSAVLLQNPNSNSKNTVLATFKGPDGPTNALPKSDTASLKEIITNGNTTANSNSNSNANATANATPSANISNNFQEFEDAEDAEEENAVEPQSENNSEINLSNLPIPPKINNTIPIKPTRVGGGGKSLSLFKQLELMVGSTVNLAKKATRKVKKMGRKLSRRIRRFR